ncbi:hypothetical protein H6F44_14470 [Pseudanabaena sp. FACHB-1277]|uniref:Uncharacterized protein n=1 Tax=Pseudanabaena cinerea FACHB-1277 TaxID=2949581 RepID=A0A926UU06_9CYAN|nr:hypothetical protein [Pseudanabaena cinerea]MBD2151316.1 hypothetical protein [Pseudanabaena cinerea FACHB-1277]
MKKLSLQLAGGITLLGAMLGAIAATPTMAETNVSQISQAMSSDAVAQNVTSVSQLRTRLATVRKPT